MLENNIKSETMISKGLCSLCWNSFQTPPIFNKINFTSWNGRLCLRVLLVAQSHFTTISLKN